MYCTNKNLHDGYMHFVYGYFKLSNLIRLYGVSTCIVHSYRDDLCYMYIHVCCVALPLVCLFDLACFFLSSFSSLISTTQV